MDNSLRKGRITHYSNKIGLFDTTKSTFINGSGDVILSFPFKDCILEGGMSDEESGREEKFFHETLDRADIDVLRDPKVLTRFEKIDANGIHPVEDPDEINFWDEDGNLRENLLIKGNNLITLYSLRQKLAGRVKLIYIDPPYNTGSDGFRYNDNFNHSTWLVFMRNRLEIARELLREDGVIFVQCDNKEVHYLKVLMDEVYGREHFKNALITKKGTKNVQSQFETVVSLNAGYDTLLFYSKSDSRIPNLFNKLASLKQGSWNNHWRGTDRPTMRYELFNILPESGQWRWEESRSNLAVKNYIELKEYCLSRNIDISKLDEKTFDTYYIQYISTYGLNPSEFELLRLSKNGKPEHYIPQTDENLLNENWLDISVKGSITEFEHEKNERILERILNWLTSPGDLILDYHLGSGTTAAVAHKMGRRWIGIEQMDYIEDIAKVRLQKVIEGEQGGISKSVDWQGGGNFVYMELRAYNIEFIERIDSARTKEELHSVYIKMASNAFLQFWFERKHWERDENYQALPLDEQKKKLRELLDLNQLYLNIGDMHDTRHQVSPLDISLTEKFYGKAN